jgi:heme/copper-type cytochrome/quinol oxidase subunit 2
MSWLVWLILIIVVVVVIVAALFVVKRRRTRSGSVLATPESGKGAS